MYDAPSSQDKTLTITLDYARQQFEKTNLSAV